MRAEQHENLRKTFQADVAPIGVERAARDAEHAPWVVTTLEGDPGGVVGAVAPLLEQGVDGIVVSEPIDEGAVSLSVGVPVLVLGAPAAIGGTRTVAPGVGAELLARTTAEHLLDLGHRTVHHVAGPGRWFAARDRPEGRRSALTARGVEQPAVLVGDRSAASGHEAGRALAADGHVTAVFAAADDMAIGVIRALTEAARRVPEDVSVVGFDDIPFAA
ncbi:DNA-binding LacI/PurR family transcriptional regulator [Streptomyces afghaniensis]|nr:DNA-binding LacI/PurR family transcriptional regulator [Streptomyces afghaniensis]